MRPSVLVCALVVAVTASCGREASETTAPPPAAAAPPPVLTESIAGWGRDGAVQRFGPGNLWEYINGAAEQYLAHGFQELETARYVKPGGRTVTVDLYRMADRLQAFGIFAAETNPKREPAAIGVAGRLGSDTAEFWSGPYYAKLVVMPGGPDAKALVSDLARGLASVLGPPGGMPEQISLLPAEGLVPGSIRLVPEDALGQASFAGALQGSYAGTPAPSTLLLIPFADGDRAAAEAEQYRSFLGKGGQAPKALSLADGGFVARDTYYGQVVAARSGRWLLVSLGAADERAAADLIGLAAARVRGASPPAREAGR